MSSTEATREIVMRYWKSWQDQDFQTMRACLADNCTFNLGAMKFDSADQMAKIVQETGSPWTDVRLIDSVFNGPQGSLIYEGFDTGEKRIVRIAEFLHVEGAKIAKTTSVIAPIV